MFLEAHWFVPTDFKPNLTKCILIPKSIYPQIIIKKNTLRQYLNFSPCFYIFANNVAKKITWKYFHEAYNRLRINRFIRKCRSLSTGQIYESTNSL